MNRTVSAKLSAIDAMTIGNSVALDEHDPPLRPLIPEGRDNIDAFSDWAIDLAYWMRQIGVLPTAVQR